MVGGSKSFSCQTQLQLWLDLVVVVVVTICFRSNFNILMVAYFTHDWKKSLILHINDGTVGYH